jgi:predicted HTH domain antitoxin
MEVIFPNELLVALREEPEGFRQKVLIYTLGKLYEMGRISGGFAAQIVGCDLWEFYRLLSEHGFAVIDYPEAELSAEADSSEWQLPPNSP